MDLSNVRRMSKQPYETVREQFEELGDRVIARHWDDGAPVRQGYRRFLGTLDELAGRLLDDEQIAQRGQDLLREDQTDGAAEDEAAAWAGAGPQGAAAPDETPGAAEPRETAGAPDAAEAAGAATGEAGDSVWSQASDEADAADGTGGAGAPGAAAGAGDAAGAAGAGAAGDAGAAQTVDVVFALPADTAAEHVALCGEFNDWSPDSISLTRGDDGSWQVTVPLAPGSYRYKYLLDGETWENAADADRYEENAYGTVDSVIVVS
jgi:hypothetical protein